MPSTHPHTPAEQAAYQAELDAYRAANGLPQLEARYCAECRAYTFNAEHLCPRYDGPACQVCGEATLGFTIGAPGYGRGRECRNGHVEMLGSHGILTPEQTR